MQRTLDVGAPATAWVAYGYNIVWETVRTHHFDAVTLSGVPIQCGNGDCFTGEDPCNCGTDCGPPAASETLCDDGLDDDCDGFTDCVDSDCDPDPVCAGVVCDGDWVCETGENSCDCWVDCGPPPVQEQDCGNGVDEDCDGLVDCDDFFDCGFMPPCIEPPACNNDGTCETDEDCNNCPTDCFSGTGAVCGNGVCETADGEDCNSCPDDCNGYVGGKPSGRYCCGDGSAQYGVTCADARCTGEGNTCTTDPALASCCGDGLCEGSEDAANCGIDCGCSSAAECDDFEQCTVDECVSGICQNTPVADDTSCSGGVCCGGLCTVPACSSALDCDDGEACTSDMCLNADTCAASCENTWPACGLADDCCGPACTSDTDPDCVSCLPKGVPCSTNDECCSGLCRGGKCK
jgi:hypothetical protein